MKDPMLDPEFLKELDHYNNKEVYAKIIALDFKENPLETLEGVVTGGSINIDGTSAVRRTCSLTMVAQEVNINDFYWGIKTKFKLYIGLKNRINTVDYPEIIWFNQGTYIISSFSTSHGTSNYSISLQGKDKMCLLNGDLGGTIPSLTWDFGKQYEYDANNNLTIVQKRVEDIIYEVVQNFAHEPLENIIVQDIDNYGLELLEYRYASPLYLRRNVLTDEVENLTLNGSNKVVDGSAATYDSIPVYDTRVNLDQHSATSSSPRAATQITDSTTGTTYTIGKVEYGETAGYRRCDLVYAGDLIGNVGEPVTTACLDKLVSMLGDFEYFYDINGRFVFRRKPSYINSSWNTIKNAANKGNTYVESAAYSAEVEYFFSGGDLITSYNNNPNLDNLRNDFSIWGTRTSVTGSDLPIHLRYAIDVKPTTYTTITVSEEEVGVYNRKYEVRAKPQTSTTYTTDKYDWREIIYQMAEDYLRWNHLEDFRNKLADRNPEYPTGITGYETYYVDMDGFWRQIYDPTIEPLTTPTNQLVYYRWNEDTNTYEDVRADDCTTYNDIYQGYTDDELTELINSGKLYYWELEVNTHNKVIDTTNKYTLLTSYSADIRKYALYVLNDAGEYELLSTKPQLYTYNMTKGYVDANYIIEHDETKMLKTIRYSKSLTYYEKDNNGDFVEYPVKYFTEDGLYAASDINLSTYWTFNLDSPEVLNFWFDFLEGALVDYSVHAIGDRPKGVNDSNVKAIYFRDTPTVVYINSDNWDFQDKDSAYTYVKLPLAYQQLFTISSQGKSAMDTLENYLYNYSYAAESISLNTIPIYYLEPNARISVFDEASHINGEYIITTMSIPLTYNGTMSISATKAVDSMYEQRR